jgi:hypothetical protein
LLNRHGGPGAGYRGAVSFNAPYEDQAKRLFVRMDKLREEIGGRDQAWFAEQADVVLRFFQTGDLPGDERRLEALLVMVEFDLLSAHKQGLDVAPGMALCAAVGRDDEEALDELCKLARAGRLLRRGRGRTRRAARTPAAAEPAEAPADDRHLQHSNVGPAACEPSAVVQSTAQPTCRKLASSDRDAAVPAPLDVFAIREGTWSGGA